MLKTIALAYLAIVAFMSVITFLVYGWDKRQARKDGWRTPERRLHALALLGGWPGALLGQRFFRHKTRKLGFKIVTWVIVAMQLAAIGGTCYYFWQPPAS